eukprot:1187646-Prorocentrum_minimum.AAC.3
MSYARVLHSPRYRCNTRTLITFVQLPSSRSRSGSPPRTGRARWGCGGHQRGPARLRGTACGSAASAPSGAGTHLPEEAWTNQTQKVCYQSTNRHARPPNPPRIRPLYQSIRARIDTPDPKIRPESAPPIRARIDTPDPLLSPLSEHESTLPTPESAPPITYSPLRTRTTRHAPHTTL